MSSLFSAYVRSAPGPEWARKLAALVAMSWALWQAIDGGFSQGSVPGFLLAGGLVLAIALVTRSSKLTLGLATLGATLVVVGLITASLAPSCEPESGAESRDGFELICL